MFKTFRRFLRAFVFAWKSLEEPSPSLQPRNLTGGTTRHSDKLLTEAEALAILDEISAESQKTLEAAKQRPRYVGKPKRFRI